MCAHSPNHIPDAVRCAGGWWMDRACHRMAGPACLAEGSQARPDAALTWGGSLGKGAYLPLRAMHEWSGALARHRMCSPDLVSPTRSLCRPRGRLSLCRMISSVLTPGWCVGGTDCAAVRGGDGRHARLQPHARGHQGRAAGGGGAQQLPGGLTRGRCARPGEAAPPTVVRKAPCRRPGRAGLPQRT